MLAGGADRCGDQLRRDKRTHTIMNQNNVVICAAACFKAVAHRILALGTSRNKLGDLAESVTRHDVGATEIKIGGGNCYCDAIDKWVLFKVGKRMRQNWAIAKKQVLFADPCTLHPAPKAGGRQHDDNAHGPYPYLETKWQIEKIQKPTPV
jgi:hypothetical protein